MSMICPCTGKKCGLTGCVDRCMFSFNTNQVQLGWQQCPNCNGSGIAMNYNNEVPTIHDTCDVCQGKKIISVQTGQPPQ